MLSRSKVVLGTVATAALLSFCTPVFAQSDDGDPHLGIAIVRLGEDRRAKGEQRGGGHGA